MLPTGDRLHQGNTCVSQRVERRSVTVESSASDGPRVALVTGGGSGIGKASVLALARVGHTVLVVDRDGDSAVEVAQAAASSGTDSVGLCVDVTDREAVTRVFREYQQKGMVPDVVVNCAGLYDKDSDGAIHTVPVETFDRIMDVNLRGTYHVCAAAIPGMLEKGRGSIVNIASRAAVNGISHHAYSAAKGAVAAMTRSMGVSYAEFGIRCNALAPGPIDTPMIPWASEPTGWADRLQTVPAKRPGRPEEVASLIVYLASDDSAYVNAQVLSIDGGAAAC